MVPKGGEKSQDIVPASIKIGCLVLSLTFIHVKMRTRACTAYSTSKLASEYGNSAALKIPQSSEDEHYS